MDWRFDTPSTDEGFTAPLVPFGLHPFRTRQAQPRLIGWRMTTHDVDMSTTLDYCSGLQQPLPAQPIGCSAFRHWSASLAAPTSWPTMPSADFCHPARSPEVSSAAFRAQSPDLRSACLMDMDFAVPCLLVPRSRLLSGFCSSTRAFAPRFLQTPIMR